MPGRITAALTALALAAAACSALPGSAPALVRPYLEGIESQGFACADTGADNVPSGEHAWLCREREATPSVAAVQVSANRDGVVTGVAITEQSSTLDAILARADAIVGATPLSGIPTLSTHLHEWDGSEQSAVRDGVGLALSCSTPPACSVIISGPRPGVANPGL